MSMVKFATLCDVSQPCPDGWRDGMTCGKRSEEYESWPRCRVCGAHCCPDHSKPGTKIDADLDQPETVVCLGCEEEK